jgi:hypothetical protein
LAFSPAKLQRLKTLHHLNVPCLAPERTDFLQSIGIDAETTPVGIIARLGMRSTGWGFRGSEPPARTLPNIRRRQRTGSFI